MNLDLNQEPQVTNEINLKRIGLITAGVSLVLVIASYIFINVASTSDVSAKKKKGGGASYITWTGNSGTNWNNTSNWSGGVPGSSDVVKIPGGLSNYPTVASNATAKEIQINSTGSGGKITVESGGSLSVDGKIDVSSDGNLIQTGGTISVKGIDCEGDINQSSGSIFSTDNIKLYYGASLLQSGGLVHLAASASDNPKKGIEVNSGSSAAQTGGTMNFKDFKIKDKKSKFTQNENTGTSLITIGHDYKNEKGGEFSSTAGTVKWTGVAAAGKGAKFNDGDNQFHHVTLEGSNNPGLGKNDDDELSVSGNWINNNSVVTLSYKSTTVIFNGSGVQTIGGSYPTSFYSLEIDNSYSVAPQVSLGNNVEITDELSLTDGILSLGDYDIVMTGSASLSGASDKSFAYTGGTGVFTWEDCESRDKRKFPVGCTSTPDGYAPLELSFNKNHTTDDYSVSVVDVMTTNGTKTGTKITDNIIQATWYVDEGSAGGTDLNFEFQWGSKREGKKLNRNKDLRLRHYTNSSWDEPSGKKARITGNGPYKTKIKGYTGSFSPFGLGGDGPPLPIELLFFKAEKSEAQVNLNWSTASEEGNDFFTLERSRNGIEFKTIGKVQGAGNSLTVKNYTFTDDAPWSGRNFYRLKQTDFDKQTSYSQIEMVDFNNGEITEVSVFPNPTSNTLNIKGLDNSQEEYEILITSVSGAVVRQEMHTNYSDNANLSIDVSGLNPGIYFLSTSNLKQTKAIRFVVRR
jgi:Secretion system C-terminal sorting domain